MKNTIAALLICLIFSGCCKLKKENYSYKYDCDKLTGYHKFIYEPIILSEDCNCVVSGKVKYVKDCSTVALIDYGDGACDNIATKIICVDGKCFDENKNPIDTYDFTINCNGNTIDEGLVDTHEIEQLYDPSSGPQPWIT